MRTIDKLHGELADQLAGFARVWLIEGHGQNDSPEFKIISTVKRHRHRRAAVGCADAVRDAIYHVADQRRIWPSLRGAGLLCRPWAN